MRLALLLVAAAAFAQKPAPPELLESPQPVLAWISPAGAVKISDPAETQNPGTDGTFPLRGEKSK